MLAKRFIDTLIFDDEWFCDLSKDSKLFFIYFITKCDHAGILRLNKNLCKFQTGITDFERVSKELANCFLTVKEDLLFMPKYLKFQYPNFPQSQIRQQDSAIKILKSFNLWDEKVNSYLTVSKELVNSYVNVNVNVINNKDGEIKNLTLPTETEFLDYCKSFLGIKYLSYEFSLKAKFESWVENKWKDGNDNKIKNWKTKIKNTIPFLKTSTLNLVPPELTPTQRAELRRKQFQDSL